MKKNYCIIRRDLQAEGLRVPIGVDKNVYAMTYYGEKSALEYRWREDDTIFEVKVGDKWLEAYSIDFDFLD